MHGNITGNLLNAQPLHLRQHSHIASFGRSLRNQGQHLSTPPPKREKTIKTNMQRASVSRSAVCVCICSHQAYGDGENKVLLRRRLSPKDLPPGYGRAARHGIAAWPIVLI